MSEKQNVIIKNIDSYTDPSLNEAVAASLDSLGGACCKGKRVLVKPNILGAADPGQAVTTHPAVLRAVVSYFLSVGAVVRVGDSPAIDSYRKACRKTGIAQVCADLGVELVEFNRTRSYPAPEGRYVRRFECTEMLSWADHIVTVPKMKTHLQMYYTGAVKNMFGMICGIAKSRYHVRFIQRDIFAGMIVDLNTIIRPSFAVMDAVWAMEGDGPRNGTPKNTGFIAVSRDMVALDCVCSTAMGYDSGRIPILADALSRRNFYIDTTEHIAVTGDRNSLFDIPGFHRISYTKDVAFMRKLLPPAVYRLLRRLLIQQPSFNRKRCVLCGQCVAICPAGALHIENGRVLIDPAACIHCYCCHEACPYDAIVLR